MKIFSLFGEIIIKSDKAFKSLDRMNKGLSKVVRTGLTSSKKTGTARRKKRRSRKN